MHEHSFEGNPSNTNHWSEGKTFENPVLDNKRSYLNVKLFSLQ